MSELPTIRKATPADCAGILECLRIAFEPYRTSYPPDAFLDTVITPEALEQHLATMPVFVAQTKSGEIIGTIACHVVNPADHSAAAQEKEGHLRGMAALPAWQGSGVAQQLLSAVEFELRAAGCSHISLDTTEPLVKAIRFYEKNGYRNSGNDTYFCGMRRLEFVKTLKT